MQDRKARAVAALLGVALLPANAFASAPAGVWVKVQEVVFAPDATNPTQVQIHGALMLFDGNPEPSRPYAGYTSPAFGYVYYECPEGQAATCRQEWTDIQANISAPDTTCVGFGMNSLPTGTLRQPNSVAEKPDVYPIQNGVSAGFTPCQVIAQFLSSESGGAGGAGGTSSAGTSTGGTITSTGGTITSTGGTITSTGGTITSVGGRNTGGKPTSSGGEGSGDKTPVSGAAGSNTTGSGTGGTSAGGGAGSGSGNLDANEPAEPRATDSTASGCSIAEATGAASIFGLGAALGLVGLAWARRRRSRT